MTEDLTSYDLDGQHRFQLGRRQEVIWGLAARLMVDDTESDTSLAFLPANKTLQLGGHPFLKKKLSPKPGSADLNGGSGEGNDREHQFLIQSSADLPGRLDLDGVLRFVDALPDPRVPSYAELDLRLGWKATEQPELAVVGQNLLHREHIEFNSSPSAREVQRGVYGRITWR